MAGSMCFRPRKKNGRKGGGLVVEAYQRWKNKTYPMTTEANLTRKPKSKIPQVAGDPESVTGGGDVRMQTAMHEDPNGKRVRVRWWGRGDCMGARCDVWIGMY